MESKELTVQEIKEAMISNVSPLKLSEIVDIVVSKNEKEVIKKLKKYGKKYNTDTKTKS